MWLWTLCHLQWVSWNHFGAFQCFVIKTSAASRNYSNRTETQKRTVLVARVNDPQFSQKSISTLSPNKSWIKKAAFEIKFGAFNLTMKISFLRADFHLTLMSAVRFGIWNFALVVIGCAMLQSRNNLALWLAAKLSGTIWQYGRTEPFGTLSVQCHLLVQPSSVL
jgi:hypothetical protein